MIDINVTVTGPGGVISYEVEVIRRALIAAGISVEFVDLYTPAPEAGDWFAVQASKTRGTAVKLIANHQPWGG